MCRELHSCYKKEIGLSNIRTMIMVGIRQECPNYGPQANCGLSTDFKWPVESNKLTLSFELRTNLLLKIKLYI